jgi:hypothetical protein
VSGSAIDHDLLGATAFDILTRDLKAHGNTLSDMHRAALFELVDTMASYTTGEASGRKAFALPTGMGKTSAVVAFITALDRLGYEVPVSVAASKVEALCGLVRDLEHHGVKRERIGLKHAVPGASEPSTGNEERLYELVTHARIRSGKDFELFGMYQGRPRALCIYDETLLRADCFAFNELQVRMALGALGPLAEDLKAPALSALQDYLQESSGIIKGALDTLRASGDDLSQGLAISLPYREEATLHSWALLLASHSSTLRASGDILGQLLAVSQEELQVLTTQQGQGVIAVRQAVPAALRDVVILDASTPIRELARLDPSITMVESFAQGDLKSFEAVEVRQLVAAGSRSSVEQSYSAGKQETSAISLEVVDIIKRELVEDPKRSFLIFSFVSRSRLDVQAQLKNDLKASGIDLEAFTPDFKRRFNFLTWGQHEGINGFEYCQTVILAGVLHRAHLDIAAAIKGQQGHRFASTSGDLVRHVVESELAHCVYQAASRGSCRRVHLGKALPMRLYLIHRGLGLKTMLDKVMSGAVWSYPEPRYLKKAAADGRTAAMLGTLLEHLRGQPEETQKVSTRAIKAALKLSADSGTSQAFTRAAGLLELAEHGWTSEGRSLLRGAAAHGFTPT